MYMSAEKKRFGYSEVRIPFFNINTRPMMCDMCYEAQYLVRNRQKCVGLDSICATIYKKFTRTLCQQSTFSNHFNDLYVCNIVRALCDSTR